MPCISAQFDPKIGPLIGFGVALPGTLVSGGNLVGRFYTGLLDSGASGTCISAQIVSDVGLSPVGKTAITTASHAKISANTYLVDVAVALFDPGQGQVTAWVVQNVQVTEFTAPKQFQVLVGRNFLCNGLFMMSPDNRFTLCM